MERLVPPACRPDLLDRTPAWNHRLILAAIVNDPGMYLNA
jgi:hypothetical protein